MANAMSSFMGGMGDAAPAVLSKLGKHGSPIDADPAAGLGGIDIQSLMSMLQPQQQQPNPQTEQDQYLAALLAAQRQVGNNQNPQNQMMNQPALY